jgi:hypothetical protein
MGCKIGKFIGITSRVEKQKAKTTELPEIFIEIVLPRQ